LDDEKPGGYNSSDASMHEQNQNGGKHDHHAINWHAPSSAAKRGAGVGETSSKAPPPKKIYVEKFKLHEKTPDFLNWHESFS
jgi:hypothetical protein